MNVQFGVHIHNHFLLIFIFFISFFCYPKVEQYLMLSEFANNLNAESTSANAGIIGGASYDRKKSKTNV